MQPITLKLTYTQAEFLRNCIDYAFTDVDEREYVVNNDLEGLLILATLRPLYIKLVNITAMYFISTKSIKLEPTASLAIHRLFNSFVEVGEEHPMFAEIITLCNQIHQTALISGEYLKLPRLQSNQRSLQSNTNTLFLQKNN